MDIHQKWVASMQPLLSNDGQSIAPHIDFEDICSIALDVLDNEEASKWALGDMAASVETKYGDGRFDEFADRVKQKRGTLRNRKTLSSFWKHETRWGLLAYQNIGYEHFKIAMALGNKLSDDPDDALQVASDFIVECADNDWKVGIAAIKSKEKQGISVDKYQRIDEMFAISRKHDSGMNLAIIQGDVAKLDDESKYRIVVYEILETGNGDTT